MNLSVYGTDEFTHGQQVINPPLSVYNSQLNALQADLQTPWNRSYPAINTCNAIIQLGSGAADLSAVQKTALIAEAKYLRAQWYFILVTTFGPVTLDPRLRCAGIQYFSDKRGYPCTHCGCLCSDNQRFDGSIK